jgi:hypothetical protein
MKSNYVPNYENAFFRDALAKFLRGSGQYRKVVTTESNGRRQSPCQERARRSRRESQLKGVPCLAAEPN